jgi:hypothetical protein
MFDFDVHFAMLAANAGGCCDLCRIPQRYCARELEKLVSRALLIRCIFY